MSEKSRPPHTAGIVPSIYTIPSYGRVQFYDIAGDPESTFIGIAARIHKIFHLLVIGSHSDLLPNRREVRRNNDFIQSMISKYDKESVYFSLDCC